MEHNRTKSVAEQIKAKKEAFLKKLVKDESYLFEKIELDDIDDLLTDFLDDVVAAVEPLEQDNLKLQKAYVSHVKRLLERQKRIQELEKRIKELERVHFPRKNIAKRIIQLDDQFNKLRADISGDIWLKISEDPTAFCRYIQGRRDELKLVFEEGTLCRKLGKEFGAVLEGKEIEK